MIFKILFVFCFITFGDSVRKFNGFTVYRINPQTDQQLKYLKEFSETQHEIDFWTYPSSIGRTVDVMVDPNQKSLVENFLREKSFKYEVMIQDLEKLLIDVKHEPKTVNRAVDPFFNAYQRLSVIEQYVDNLVQQNPSIASKQIYGTSTEGRDLTVLKLQYNTTPNKPIVFIDATIHAREWITTTTTLWFVQALIDGLNSGDSAITQLLSDFDFHIVPVVNPDGYEYSHTDDRMWRKTRSTVSSTTCPGVDGNRNYNHNWTTIGSSSNPCSTTFHGSAPNSEPEVKAITDYMQTIGSNIKLYIAVHSYGQYMLSPWGYTTALPANNADLLAKSKIFLDVISTPYNTIYTAGPSSTTLYATSGSSVDWAYGVTNIPYAYTLELRDKGTYGFAVPVSYIQPSGEETTPAIIALVQAIGQTLKVKH